MMLGGDIKLNIKNLNTFGKRLEFLLDLKVLRKKDLADYLNIAPSTVSGYISDARKPDLDTLKNIADYLNVNSDFLLMRNDDYQTYINKNINGKLIEIQFDDETLHLTEKEIGELLNSLKNVGWDVKKLLDTNK